MDLRTHRDLSRTFDLAVEVVMARAVLSHSAAAAVLSDVSEELGVDVEDLAAVVVAADDERRGRRDHSVVTGQTR